MKTAPSMLKDSVNICVHRNGFILVWIIPVSWYVLLKISYLKVKDFWNFRLVFSLCSHWFLRGSGNALFGGTVLPQASQICCKSYNFTKCTTIQKMGSHGCVMDNLWMENGTFSISFFHFNIKFWLSENSSRVIFTWATSENLKIR